MYRSAWMRVMRKMMLAYGRKMDPERMLVRSRQSAIRVAARAAQSSKAYGTLLREHGLDPAAINSEADFRHLPVLTKANTFERFDLGDLVRPITTHELADVLTSSGRGGKHFGFRLTARRQHEASWFDIDLGLQDVFDVDELPTLLVNCLPMGVVFRSRAATVANVSVREDMACSILRDVGPRFAQTVLCADPLFIRRVLDEARGAGVDWKALNTSVIVGEEVLVEAQRDYIATRMSIDLDRDSHRMIGSSFGVGELGLNLLFETRETIRIRRAMRRDPAVERLMAGRAIGASMPSVFCYNPLRCHVEVLDADASGYGELCFTMNDLDAVIPLPRYSTGDYGRLVDRAAVADAAAIADGVRPWLPVVLVCGRIADRPMGLPTVEEIKELLYADHGLADGLSGAFRIGHDPDVGISLTIQAATEAFAADDAFVGRVRAQVNREGRAVMRINVLAPGDFPYRPMLDFERKFRYLAV